MVNRHNTPLNNTNGFCKWIAISTTALISATPPMPRTIELIQQQLVPMSRDMTVPISDFLYGFIRLLFGGNNGYAGYS